jgi:hypothetical protein
MKSIKYLILSILSIVAILINSCSEDAEIKNEKVQFSLELSSADVNDGGRISSASEIPLGAALRVSVENNSGSSIFTMKDVELMHVGGSVITTPLELPAGTYRLTDFLIVSKDNEVLFATPKRGSALEKYVINPLNVNFTVSTGQIRNIPMEVMDVTQSAPEAFGYVSFNINVVHPLQIAVFTTTQSGVQLTNATLTIEKDEPILQTTNLLAQVNKVGFKLDPEENYKLVVTKPGYFSL